MFSNELMLVYPFHQKALMTKSTLQLRAFDALKVPEPRDAFADRGHCKIVASLEVQLQMLEIVHLLKSLSD